MIRVKLIIVYIFLSIGLFASAQSKKNGKLRVIINTNIISRMGDSCSLSIYEGSQVIKYINLIQLRDEIYQSDTLLFIDIIIPEGNYNVIIDQLLAKPILLVNLKVKKKKLSWLPLDYQDLVTDTLPAKSIVVKDVNRIIPKYMNLDTNTVN